MPASSKCLSNQAAEIYRHHHRSLLPFLNVMSPSHYAGDASTNASFWPKQRSAAAARDRRWRIAGPGIVNKSEREMAASSARLSPDGVIVMGAGRTHGRRDWRRAGARHLSLWAWRRRGLCSQQKLMYGVGVRKLRRDTSSRQLMASLHHCGIYFLMSALALLSRKGPSSRRPRRRHVRAYAAARKYLSIVAAI